MSSKMYSFLNQLEEMMENGEVSEGCYLKLCNSLKDVPKTDSQEDYWRENFEREERRRMIEEERVHYLMDIIQSYENQHHCQRFYIQYIHAQQELDRLLRQGTQTPKQKLVDFFQQMERLSNIPRHKRKPYTKLEIEEMTPAATRILSKKIFEN